ncbi:sodium:solute symporter family protein [Compostibacter hankyongensis]|uniref:Sodium:solute symporter family protein n=1 Tax=Compostibacter hankyongensis TaxID=1007089 RepID=A0ABP8G434_9BACT
MHLQLIDYLIIGLYFVFVISIGFFIKKRVKTSNDFLMSNRSIPLWITSLAFISANLGAQEVIGMAASGAKYGIMTSHFYWVGAIPAMLFLGVFMMPFYYGSKARSVPEYLAKRFDEKTRGFNAITFAVMTIFSSGISLYALALLFQTILGWSFEFSIFLAAGVVLVYTFLGGLTSAVYNEVLQFFLIVLGIAPLVYLGIHQAGGWQGIVKNIPEPMTHAWKYMGDADANAMGVNIWQMAMGLGFVLSFGYWCTDFLVVQRAMIARNMTAAQKTPLIAGFPKMIMPFIVILPGIIAIALQASGSYTLPLKPDGVTPNYDMALPSLLGHFYPSGILGVGLTALFASFMSGMAGNVTAFNTVWTFDIYQSYFAPGKSDKHYLMVGKLATVFGILASIATAYLARSFNNIMDFLQLVFGFVNAPLFATFFLGMFWKKTTANGAFWGLLGGTAAAAFTHGLTLAEGKGAWIANLHEFRSTMGQNFMIAIMAFSCCFVLTWTISLFTRKKEEPELVGLVYSLTPRPETKHLVWYRKPVTLAVIVLVLTLLLNLIFY